MSVSVSQALLQVSELARFGFGSTFFDAGRFTVSGGFGSSGSLFCFPLCSLFYSCGFFFPHRLPVGGLFRIGYCVLLSHISTEPRPFVLIHNGPALRWAPPP